MSTTAQVESKPKTKAKLRYLKRKRERRKLNRKGTGHAAETGDVEVENDVEVSVLPSEDEESQIKREKRAKKRRKITEDKDVALEDVQPASKERKGKLRALETAGSFQSQDEVSDGVAKSPQYPKTVDEVDDNDLNAYEQPTIRDNDINQEGPSGLSAFPLPVLLNAPSKADLAVQGLDKGLLNAQLIPSSTTSPLLSGTGAPNQDLFLSESMVKRLNDLGITELFAVQTRLIPFLLGNPSYRALYIPYHPPPDVCVSAPTGSGKTLAYVTPIVEILSARLVTRLRALVVLPTRDLVIQVRETFEAIGKGRGLKIATITGQHSFSHEQNQLIANKETVLHGGSSKVDIVVCTPGRLIEHLKGTPNFSLQHLRFLVIDEADRLLGQSFQDWLSQVLGSLRPPKSLSDPDYTLNFTAAVHDAVAPTFMPTGPCDPRYLFPDKIESSCQKLLFSATLTRDPDKIAALHLRNPKYFIVQDVDRKVGEHLTVESFSMPTTLSEHFLVCDSSEKPLVLFYLVHTRNISNALIFTKSTESTQRLVQLFEFFEQGHGRPDGQRLAMHQYSSDLSAQERKSVLDKFKTQEIQILVSSDVISRGIDISHVSHVVSYDAPVDMRKYVHRVGRTARAGREGDAWTLVEKQEARHFKQMLKDAGHMERVKRLRVSEDQLQPLRAGYQDALARLKDLFSH